MIKKALFHMSLPCSNINKTKDFYVEVLGAKLGRNSLHWLDINLFGNQLTFTKSGAFNFSYNSYKFGEVVLPSFHFGVIVDKKTWDQLYGRCSGTTYELTKEATFLKNKTGEHISFFIKDPNRYTVEFKSFKDQRDMFTL